MNPIFLMWFRQDLRLQDNPALAQAINAGPVLPIYILDDKKAGDWKPGAASRWWLNQSLEQLNQSLHNNLWVLQGDSHSIIKKLVKDHRIKSVYWNRCYEPWQIQRDNLIKSDLEGIGIPVYTFGANLLWEPWTNLKKDNSPYKVFTPFYRNGVKKIAVECPSTTNTKKLELVPCYQEKDKIASLDLLPSINRNQGIGKSWSPGESGAIKKLKTFIQSGLDNYKTGRDFPSLNSVSKLSPHIHFGEISPRQILYFVAHKTQNLYLEEQIEHFRKELAWREFSYSLLYHFPDIPEHNMNKTFDRYPWTDNKWLLQKWQLGQTGYPLIDAGMRELRDTGYMHNRVRMIVASFLVKNLGIRWQHGAKWFWDCLLDADLANNSCGWQWVAGCGTDAAPYFRIFNPITQSQKFDPTGDYIRIHVPELRSCPDKLIHNPGSALPAELQAYGIELGRDYPFAVVNLKESMDTALATYKALRKAVIVPK